MDKIPDLTDYTDPELYYNPDPRQVRACIACGLLIADMGAAGMHQIFHETMAWVIEQKASSP